MGAKIKRLPNWQKGPTENQIQIAYIEWAELRSRKIPELQLVYHIPNGSHKSPAARGLFKRLGQKAGVPDIHLPIGRGQYIGLWIEFKSDKGRISEVQKRWHRLLEASGHRVVMSKDWKEAANITLDYLGISPDFII
jgi:hypothetical protein